MKSAKIAVWPLAAALIAGLIFVNPAHALRVAFQSKGDSDRLTFSFDSKVLPESSVSRTGREEIVVSLPAGIWNTEAKPTVKDSPGKLVSSITATEQGVRIVTKTNAFGYIRVPSSGKPEFVLQIFRDPIGARWEPPAPAQAAISPLPTPPAVGQPVQTEQPGAARVAQALDAVVPPNQPAADPLAQSAIRGEADLPVDPTEEGRKPFFAVPYSVRNEVEAPPGAVTAEQQAEPLAPPVSTEVETGTYPPVSELRFKAVNKTAEEVKFAELAGEGGQAAMVPEPGTFRRFRSGGRSGCRTADAVLGSGGRRGPGRRNGCAASRSIREASGRDTSVHSGNVGTGSGGRRRGPAAGRGGKRAASAANARGTGPGRCRCQPDDAARWNWARSRRSRLRPSSLCT